MHPMRLASVILVLVLQVVAALAQQAVLTGSVTDRMTGTAVQGVTVRIEGTRLGAITDKQGRFRIANPPSGPVVIAASCVGYQAMQVTITIGKDRTADAVLTIIPSDVVKSDVIVSASKRVQAVQDVPISVAVMRAADIDQRNITQLDEALTYVSGVTVARDQVNIRGASGFALGAGSRTAVLLDGFPLISGDAGDIKFDVLPVADIERIEIIKGAGSALYGTGALGGVVSLMTKDPTEQPEFSARLYGGAYTLPRYEQWRYRQTMPTQSGADLRYAQKHGNVSMSVSGGFRADESYRDLDAGHRGFAFGKTSWQINDASRLTLFGLYAASLKQNLLYWKSLAEATRATAEQNPNEQLWSSKLALAGEWSSILSGNTSILVRPGLYRTHFENRYLDATAPGQPGTAYAYNLEVQSTSRIGTQTVLTSGVNGRLNHVMADVYGQQLQMLYSAYSQAEYTLDTDIIITGGLRADYEQTRGLNGQFVVSPKLGLTYKLADQTALRASAGRGFRAATVAERYANVRYGPLQVVKNESITAEYSWSIEAGINHIWSDGIIPM
ncbi:MAG: TonB-dependent receptor, partial [Candidatus Kapabacteria bacterium]|nr:TonB-dependent receptor [Candidatus Kapabacteria bacterium]